MTETPARFEWAPGVVLPRPRHGSALSPEKVRLLLKLEREGLPRAAITERLGVSLRVVLKYLRLAGFPHRPGYPRPRRIFARRVPMIEHAASTPLEETIVKEKATFREAVGEVLRNLKKLMMAHNVDRVTLDAAVSGETLTSELKVEQRVTASERVSV